jgi:hypothetical protein
LLIVKEAAGVGSLRLDLGDDRRYVAAEFSKPVIEPVHLCGLHTKEGDGGDHRDGHRCSPAGIGRTHFGGQ